MWVITSERLLTKKGKAGIMYYSSNTHGCQMTFWVQSHSVPIRRVAQGAPYTISWSLREPRDEGYPRLSQAGAPLYARVFWSGRKTQVPISIARIHVVGGIHAKT